MTAQVSDIPQVNQAFFFPLGVPSYCGVRGPRVFQPLLELNPDQRKPLFSFIYQTLAKSSPFSRLSHSNPTYPFLQSVCSALWGLCGGHLSHRAGDACRGRCVPPALLHLQCLFLPPADWRPLCPQGRTASVCQRGLPPVSGQPNLL